MQRPEPHNTATEQHDIARRERGPASLLTEESAAETDSPALDLAMADRDEPSDCAGDIVFVHEQNHLDETCDTLEDMAANVRSAMDKARKEAAADKRSMSEELAFNTATYADAMETYADFAAMNRVVDGYNRAQDANAEKLANIHLLLKQPYFAKVVLQFKAGQEPKELYIGNAGISDESYRRLIVDWRSPVAEVYYNQDNGPTSYRADGRTIDVDLKLRRQFDIQGRTLNAYFDTSVAIQDSLLLASLSKQRSAHMQAITATIQKEQNHVVRHDDVPVLLVNGIAGSGKTSVLMQRIAYLFYQNRGTLGAEDVFLISPNPVFSRYIDRVLPDLGEANPETLTWDELAARLLPAGTGSGNPEVDPALLDRIDEATRSFEFDADDFKDIACEGKRLVSADQIKKIAGKFKNVPAGPHRVTLMREELAARLQSRLKQMAGDENVHDEVAALSIEEQLRIFHETIDPQNENEERVLALRFLNDRYARAFETVERDEWLRIDRIAKRLLGNDTLAPTAWLYLKMALTGMGNPDAKYVLIDEVQDYTLAQLAVMARYFRRAHFLLLGDKNQAITAGTATFDEIRTLFEKTHGSVESCDLMTSYRSSPEITELFARLLTDEERMQVSSIQRTEAAPIIKACATDEEYERELRQAIGKAQGHDGLTAVIVPYAHRAKGILSLLENDAACAAGDDVESAARDDEACAVVDDTLSANGACVDSCRELVLINAEATLPENGTVIVPLKYAKGLEFDRVIVPDASASVFPDDPLARRQLYTTLSRATRNVTVLSRGPLTPLIGKLDVHATETGL